MVAAEVVRLLTGAEGVVVVGGLLALVGTSGYVVRASLSYALGADYTAAIGTEVKDTGFVIGKAENVLVYVLILAGAYTALAVIFAAKSLVRREDITSGDTTYYLAGTMVNFTYSVAFAQVVAVLVG
jgi:hypothetical protein